MSSAFTRRNRGRCAARGDHRMAGLAVVGPVAADVLVGMPVNIAFVVVLYQDLPVLRGTTMAAHDALAAGVDPHRVSVRPNA